MPTDQTITNYSTEIKQHINSLDHSLTILIAGVYGVGKTTLSYNISKELEIKQRASLGVITKTLQAIHGNRKYIRSMDTLYEESRNFRPYDLFSKNVCGIINSILRVADADGVDYLIDGVQLDPKYLVLDKYKLLLYIKSPESSSFKEKLNTSTTHPLRYRKVNENQVNVLKQLEKHVLSSIKEKPNIKILDFVEGEENMTFESLRVIKNWTQSLVKQG